jgi:hypothetical protein
MSDAERNRMSGSYTIDRLLDEAAIRRVIQMISRAFDRGDADLLKSAYHPDAIEERGGRQIPVETFMAEVWPRIKQNYSMLAHYVGSINVLDLEGDTAHVETYVCGMHLYSPANGEQERIMWGGSRYVDIFERRNGEWRIARRTLVIDWTHEQPHQYDPEATKDFTHGQRFTRDDPSYFGR